MAVAYLECYTFNFIVQRIIIREFDSGKVNDC